MQDQVRRVSKDFINVPETTGAVQFFKWGDDTANYLLIKQPAQTAKVSGRLFGGNEHLGKTSTEDDLRDSEEDREHARLTL